MSSDDVAGLLRRHRLRVTPQRRAILNAFRGTRDEHLSAEEVLSRASQTVPEIGRGTVYATLAELAELGLLESVGNPEPVRYETNVEPHDHFRCRLCLRLFDVQLGGRDLKRRALPGYSIEAVAVHAEGICVQCHQFERGVIDGARDVIARRTLSDDVISQLSCVRVESPVGELALGASSRGIVRVAFEDHADFDALSLRAKTRRGSVAGRDRLVVLNTGFTGYWGGGRDALADLIDWHLLAHDAADLLRSVQSIPYAAPISYDRIMATMSAYDCGVVVGTDPMPLLIPCHRVKRGLTQLEAYVGGLERLHYLQNLESELSR
ncbi:MAG TPA: transcriptional repressor [Solirubrobacteraceae bacterium]|jgi:Fe2+ or Zn2+ uptake regulation protein/O6-methylguanine-DNA--protein-cysteine methyltransferase|nr:transcriptional repressor [Solirubrobacteraceae bacterium]